MSLATVMGLSDVVILTGKEVVITAVTQLFSHLVNSVVACQESQLLSADKPSLFT